MSAADNRIITYLEALAYFDADEVVCTTDACSSSRRKQTKFSMTGEGVELGERIGKGKADLQSCETILANVRAAVGL
jgi:hypothetical protein